MKALFLDRDGVINRRLPDSYVSQWSEFVFEKSVLDALANLKTEFDLFIVLTNQQGIGKGLMSEKDLIAIHQRMVATIAENGGKIDAVYYCPHLREADCECRKPKIGLAKQALHQFPEIHLPSSWIIGDSASDMLVGFQLDLKTALVDTKEEEKESNQKLQVNMRVMSLHEFAGKVKDYVT